VVILNPIGKKFISLFLIFSLMMLSVNLYAKERREAEIIITKKNGLETSGELIAVKKDSLLLLFKRSGIDVSVKVEEIKVIRVVKKSKALLGAGIGFLIAGSIGALLSLTSDDEIPPAISAVYSGVILGVPVGALAGAVEGRDTKIQLEEMTDSEIQETLDKLRKKARVRDYK
jgi:hypothetical protein